MSNDMSIDDSEVVSVMEYYNNQKDALFKESKEDDKKQ